ncbi:MAG: hypothetical protein JXA90_12585, partial [Planctomycetes bacterium]|nr:hypothetical protein [Planctomycetota bacterium]
MNDRPIARRESIRRSPPMNRDRIAHPESPQPRERNPRRQISPRQILAASCAAAMLLALADIPAADPLEPRADLQQPAKAPPPPDGLRWRPGPCLLLDDFLVERSENLSRKVTPPRRHPAPIVTGAGDDGKGDRCFQPYFTVIRDPVTR